MRGYRTLATPALPISNRPVSDYDLSPIHITEAVKSQSQLTPSIQNLQNVIDIHEEMEGVGSLLGTGSPLLQDAYHRHFKAKSMLDD